MKKTATAVNCYNVSISYIRHLLQISAGWGVPERDLLDGSGLSLSVLKQSDARVTTRQAGLITRRLIQISGRADIGMIYGLRIRPTSHGFLGYAIMSSATLIEVMQVMHKYQSLYLNDFIQTFEVKDEEVVLTVTEGYNFGPMRQVFFEALLVTVCQHIAYLIGSELTGLRVNVDWPRPAYFDAYEARLPRWEFGRAYNQICFPRQYLSLPLVMADPIAVKHALTQVEKEMASRAVIASPDVVPRVRSALVPGVEGYPSLSEVAAKLCLSERTLKRRLNEAGNSFQSLLDEARQRRAIELIQEGLLSFQQIAQILGYTDPAAFTRAFKRWTGITPTEQRELS